MTMATPGAKYLSQTVWRISSMRSSNDRNWKPVSDRKPLFDFNITYLFFSQATPSLTIP
jgi:hypothetical protein